MSGFEQIGIGIIALIVILWFFPGIKPMLERSKQAPTDWAGLLIPIVGVVLFIAFLIGTL